jgi:hypothetical protein
MAGRLILAHTTCFVRAVAAIREIKYGMSSLNHRAHGRARVLTRAI